MCYYKREKEMPQERSNSARIFGLRAYVGWYGEDAGGEEANPAVLMV